MSTKQCLKCNHIVHFEGGPPMACPQCGAVYSKVEETLRNGGEDAADAFYAEHLHSHGPPDRR